MSTDADPADSPDRSAGRCPRTSVPRLRPTLLALLSWHGCAMAMLGTRFYIESAWRVPPGLPVVVAAVLDIEAELADLRSHAITVILGAGLLQAPAAAVAALMVAGMDADGLMLLMPADHVVGDRLAFEKAVEQAAAAAREGYLVTFGILPSAPETGYGYIRRGPALGGHANCFAVDQFVEKPDAATAAGLTYEGVGRPDVTSRPSVAEAAV